jgi:hypothetical protein
VAGIQFLPVCIMYMRLCPEGSEGATYAMLTTFGNIALVCGSNIGRDLCSQRVSLPSPQSNCWYILLLKSTCMQWTGHHL